MRDECQSECQGECQGEWVARPFLRAPPRTPVRSGRLCPSRDTDAINLNLLIAPLQEERCHSETLPLCWRLFLGARGRSSLREESEDSLFCPCVLWNDSCCYIIIYFNVVILRISFYISTFMKGFLLPYYDISNYCYIEDSVFSFFCSYFYGRIPTIILWYITIIARILFFPYFYRSIPTVILWNILLL